MWNADRESEGDGVVNGVIYTPSAKIQEVIILLILRIGEWSKGAAADVKLLLVSCVSLHIKC